MKNLRKPAIILISMLLLASVLLTGCQTPAQLAAVTPIAATDTVTIISPYADVDWQEFGQYKTALHVHSKNSDGKNTLAEMIEDHYQKDYDILAITDHNTLTPDWVSAKGGLTQERFDEIAAGVGRDGRGMLQIPYTNEQSRGNHSNSFFTDHNNKWPSKLDRNLKTIEDLGGISHINHPGRYTGGKSGGEKGENIYNDPKYINQYVDLFMKFQSCVGMEIINKKDGESASDRILWDNILTQIIPQGRSVWGFSNDDTHEVGNTGFSYNMFVMPENTTENFKAAMISGSFYAVAMYAHRELGEGFKSDGNMPVIKDIKVDDKAVSITITADFANKIEWIADGFVIAEGETLNIMEHAGKISSYVRANIMGYGGIAFTQPFEIAVK